MVGYIFSHGVPSAIAKIIAEIKMPNDAFTLHFEIRTIINTMTSANTISTYDVDIKTSLLDFILPLTAGCLKVADIIFY